MTIRWDTGAGFLFWLFFGWWLALVAFMIYLPIGIAWVIGASIWNGYKKIRGR